MSGPNTSHFKILIEIQGSVLYHSHFVMNVLLEYNFDCFVRIHLTAQSIRSLTTIFANIVFSVTSFVILCVSNLSCYC